jgi:TRAP-type C4-dicarboxylate transport system substrate-binding protein
MHRLWFTAAALLTALTLSSISKAETLKIATMAPRQSAWGKVFHAWSKAVDKKTNGKLKLRFYWNATQGDESTVVAKLRSGQIDGCTLGASGLGKIHTPALALQMPGLFRSWKGIDRATSALYPELKAAFEKQGFYLSSIGDVGRAHTMSRGRAIRVPADVRGMKPASPRRGVIAPVLASLLKVTPVRLSFPELLPALSSGRVNLMTAPALAAEQLQWAPYFDHINADITGIGVGAMVLNDKKLRGLPPDAVEVMRKTGRKAGKLLRKRVRKMDDAAYRRLSKRMTVVKLNGSERRQWQKLFAKVRRRLAQRTFPPKLVARLEALGEAY